MMQPLEDPQAPPGIGAAAGPQSPSKGQERLFTANVNRVELTWQDLVYKVRNQKTKQTLPILKGVSGYVKPGQLLAIMGPSGAGKTSLLNALAGRLAPAVEVGGNVLLNGRRRQPHSFKAIAGYVMQDDIFFSNLTVRETLSFAAHMQLPKTLSAAEVKSRVDDIIAELSLTKSVDTRIGNELVRGVSGGEKKRVNVGTQLVSNPSLLFLDEPTTGLDSFQALNVVSTLRACASRGRTVVATIHQPRSSIFQLFDMLMLVSEGECVYFGPQADVVTYFAGLDLHCPSTFNPADYVMDISALDHRSPEALEESTARVKFLTASYKSSENYTKLVQAIDYGRVASAVADDGVDPGSLKIGYFQQLFYLFQRSFTQRRRDFIAFTIGMIVFMFFALLLGLLYLRAGHDRKSIQDRSGVLFFAIMNLGFGTMGAVLNTFPTEKNVITRERASGMYRVSAYYVAKVLSEMPLQLIPPVAYAAIMYYMIGLNKRFTRFLIFVLVLTVTAQTANAMGLIISSFAPNAAAAAQLGPFVLTIFVLFGGLYLNRDSFPVGARWIQWISFIKYGYEALMINEWTGQTLTCSADDIARDNCIASGEAVLEMFSLDTGFHTLWRDIGLDVALFAGLHILAYIALRFRNRARFIPLSAE